MNKDISSMAVMASDARITGMQEKYPPRSAVISWIFFDWAAQPCFTLITTFVFAPYFATRVAAGVICNCASNHSVVIIREADDPVNTGE
jgi:MFS-type transporter involved in bile tolerance (Atg22 family)